MITPLSALAAGPNPLTNMKKIADGNYNTEKTVMDVVSLVIGTILSILGVLFVIYMFYAGYLWFTANGDEKQVGNAKKIITQSIIGLIVILASYAIYRFVFTALLFGQAS